MNDLLHKETHLTYMRRLTPADAEDSYRLNLDPEVIQFTGDTTFENIKDAEEFLNSYNQYRKFAVGRYAVIEKKTDLLIGLCGLKYNPDKDEYDIGFRFYKTYWSQGFETETAKNGWKSV